MQQGVSVPYAALGILIVAVLFNIGIVAAFKGNIHF